MNGLGLFIDSSSRQSGGGSVEGNGAAGPSTSSLSSSAFSHNDTEIAGPSLTPDARKWGRSSYPPSLPPGSEPAYAMPSPPALPTFPSDTAYSPLVQDMGGQSPISQKPDILSRSATVLKATNRKLVGTIRRSIRSPINPLSPAYKNSTNQYKALDDDEDNQSKQKGVQQSTREIDNSREDDEPVNFDVTSFTGPSIALKTINAESSAEEESQDNGTISEFNRLESQGKLTGGLGKGMEHLVTLQLAQDSPAGAKESIEPQRPITIDGKLSRYRTIREAGQREAKQRGEMIVVEDSVPAIDLSSLAGGESSDKNDTRRSTMPINEGKRSYFPPPDPNMPNWRPFSMRRPYITMLILVSLLLGGVQEYLYQRSAWLAGKNRGLIEFRSAQSISISNYFAWKYMPTIVLVTYGVLWQIVDYEVKRLEPYYQLSKPDGALAAHSLNLDYLTYWSYLAPVKALRYRQWAVVSSSVATLLAGGLVPTLQSASVTLYPDSKNRRVNELKFVRINPIWSRLLTTSLVLVAVLGLILMLQLRRRSGLLSDPKGIAGIAAMAQKSHILMDFSGLDTAKPDVIHQKLRYQRYILYKSCFWQGEYVGHDTDEPGIVPNANHHNPHPPMLRLKAGIPFIAFMIIVMILIPVFTFTSANIVTEKLPFLFTAMAVLIKLSWGTLECDVRMIEPFYILSKRNAPPKTLTLDYTGTVPGYIIFHSLINKHFLISLVGIGAIATEVLTVCVSSFAVKGSDFFPAHNNNNNNTTTPAAADHSLTHSLFARLPQALSTSPNMNTTAPDPRQQLGGDQTVRSFWISFSLAQLILLFLILAATLVYLRRRHAFLPRQPNTIASILAFIHQSTMLWQFIDTERMDSRTMTQHLTALGQTYGLGVFRGRDGEDHCGVDREPLISDYRHGHKYDFARQNRVENWEVL